MSRTLTAMFDNRSDAEAAREQLRTQLGADAQIIDQSSGGASTSGGAGGGSGEQHGFWAELKSMFVADEDRHAYAEGVRRGGYLLSASVTEEQADRACDILDRANSVDFDSRQEQWRSEGWSGRQDYDQPGYAAAGLGTATAGTGEGSLGLGSTGAGGPFGTSTNGMDDERLATTGTGTTGTSSEAYGSSSTGLGTNRGNVVQEERIPIIEEQLRVGKREVERGGARVRSYIEERPVTESINLREEHVEVERHPVDQALSAAELGGADAFQERNIEMRETAEEAVVAKEARVVEEVLVRKTADQHEEQVSDTVRRTKVDVDEGQTGTDRTAFGFDQDRTSGLESDRTSGLDQDRLTDRDTTLNR